MSLFVAILRCGVSLLCRDVHHPTGGTFHRAHVPSRGIHGAGRVRSSLCSPRSGSRCVQCGLEMYRRAVLSLYGGGIISCRRLTGLRFLDLACRRLSVGNVLWSEKSPPEDKGTGKPSDEAENKTAHKDDSSKQPEPNGLAALLSGMKVEVTSKKTFQVLKKKNPKLQSQENPDNIESASRMFQMVAEESHPEEKPVSKELSDAASAVASTYPSQQKQVESELLQQLRLHKQMAEEIRRKGSDNIRYREWTAEDWGKVIFSDESPFQLFGTSGKQLIRRRRGDRWLRLD
ncbi:unnamed protein product [Ranitomeya imitator]|uniref:Small ribosomal subunit protein mS31 n=1 Tax=Ranitomeya imitator TaxID=111125 RepID=A0ABN9M8Z0_9NEOB|nr:unnamed protein product [Ranitomeya imitator]